MRTRYAVLVALGVAATLTSVAVPASGSPSSAAMSRSVSSPNRADRVPSASRVSPYRQRRVVAGVALSHIVPAAWEKHDRISINTSTRGSQGAEAIVLFASFPGADRVEQCATLPPPSKAVRSTAALAGRVARAPGTKRLERPLNVTVGGRAAKHVVLAVRNDLGCDPGYFYTWKPDFGGAFWVGTERGDIIETWIVKVGAKLLFIEAETRGVGAAVEREIQQVIASIRFDDD